MSIKQWLAIAAALTVVAASGAAAEVSWKPVPCLDSGQPAAPEHRVAYRDGDVCFCCQGRAERVQKQPDRCRIQANHQLGASGQYAKKISADEG
jgi:hypothetical protein